MPEEKRAPTYSDAELAGWARDFIDKYGKMDLTIDLDVMRALLPRLVELIEAERDRRGRPPSAGKRQPRQFSDPALVKWAQAPTNDRPSLVAALRRFIELANRKRLPARRPRGSRLGEMVEDAMRRRGMTQIEARRAVAQEAGTSVEHVAQAHRRLSRSQPRH